MCDFIVRRENQIPSDVPSLSISSTTSSEILDLTRSSIRFIMRKELLRSSTSTNKTRRIGQEVNKNNIPIGTRFAYINFFFIIKGVWVRMVSFATWCLTTMLPSGWIGWIFTWKWTSPCLTITLTHLTTLTYPADSLVENHPLKCTGKLS